MLDLRPVNVEIGLTAMFNWCNEAFGLRTRGDRATPVHIMYSGFVF